MSPAAQARLVKKLKALSHPNRFRLFSEILEAHQARFEQDQHDCFLHTIMQRLKVTAPTVSHHLKELVNAELISTELKGKFLTCTVNVAALEELAAFFTRGAQGAPAKERGK